MASFTDNTQTPYAPYRGVDVSAYATVGMYKQQQYDAGVSKVQGIIDNISGFDVIRDTDKQYLNNKVSDITSKVNQMAGADWSNKNLLGQVGSLSNEIARDKVVQDAVYSTSAIRKLQASQKEMKEKHPERYTPQAEWLDNQSVQSYLVNPKQEKYVGPSEATPYYEYRETLDKKLKEISPDIKSYIDAYGNFQYKIDKFSQVKPETIQQVVDGFFATNPQFQKSAQIDALYTYRNEDALSLSQRISEYSDANIQEYKNRIDEFKKLNGITPNNLDGNQYAKSIIAQNEGIIKQLESSKNRYINALKEGKNLDQVKLTLFNEQLRNTAILTFQKDNNEIELKENSNAVYEDKRFLDYIKAGLDPETRKPLAPGNPYYPLFKKTSAKSKGTGEGGESEDGTISDRSVAIAQPNKPGKYNLDLNVKQITDLSSQKESYDTLLKEQFFAGQDDPNLRTDKVFAEYKAQQELLIEKGEFDQLDPNYLDYRKVTNRLNVELGTLEDIQKKAAQEAAALVPIKGTSVIEGLKKEDGSNFNLTIDYERDSKFISEFKSFYDDVQTVVNERMVNENPKYPTRSKLNYRLIASEILKDPKYANSADRHLLASMASTGELDKMYSKVMGKQDKLVEERAKVQDDLLEQYGREFTPTMHFIQGSGPEVDTWRRQIATAHRQANKEEISMEDVEPLGVWTSTDDGASMIRYQYKGKEYDVINPSATPLLETNDPYMWLNKVVNTAGHTPLKGEGVLRTENGKVRYAIYKNKFTDAYDAYVLDGSKPIRIVPRSDPNNPGSSLIKFGSSAEIVKGFEDMSARVNPYTGKQYTRDEILYWMTHDEEDLKKYILSKTNK